MTTDAIERLGLPIVLVLGIGIFLYRVFWPWMTKQVDTAQSQASKATDALTGIREVIATQNEINRRVVNYLERLERNSKKEH